MFQTEQNQAVRFELRTNVQSESGPLGPSQLRNLNFLQQLVELLAFDQVQPLFQKLDKQQVRNASLADFRRRKDGPPAGQFVGMRCPTGQDDAERSEDSRHWFYRNAVSRLVRGTAMTKTVLPFQVQPRKTPPRRA